MKLLKTKLDNERISLSLSLSLSLFIFLLGIISCQEIPDGIPAIDDQGEELIVAKNPFIDRGFGQRFYQEVNYGIEQFGKFQFYLVPQIQL